MVEGRITDDRVVQLRSQGRSYGAIAKLLGLRGGQDAFHAFRRALRRRPPAEQDRLREDELRRLDTLTERLHADNHLREEEREAKLRAVVRLRHMVTAP
jgi:hypothetical protein